MKISAVLPLKMTGRHYADNVARCDILFSSLRAFTTPNIFDRFLIIVPHDEVEDAKRYAAAWQDFPVQVIDESDYFDVFNEFSARHQIRNWHRQQIIKLYASELVDTEYFLVFDPDTFAAHHFNIDTILPNGRALTYLQPRELEARYWIASGDILRQPYNMEIPGIWMTPAILSRTLCRRLHARLEELYGINWMKVLLARYTVDWTEYTLYWMNAEREGLIDQFHTLPAPGMPALHTDESIWLPGHGGSNLDRWNADRHFGAEGNGLFAVIQSNTGLDIDRITHKLQDYFPIQRQPYVRDRNLRLKIAEFYSAVTRRALGAVRKITSR